MNGWSMRKLIRTVSLLSMFAMLCALRQWYALLLFFSLGIVLTLMFRRRIYCGYFCPLGTVSDISSNNNRKSLKVPVYLKYVVYTAFWGYIAYNVVLNIDNTQLLWFRMFRFAILIMAGALVLQVFFKNRTWCTGLCPMGKILSVISRHDAKGPVVEADKCTSCGLCTAACPLEEELAPPYNAKINTSYCLQCNKCITTCKSGAIVVK